MTEFVGAAHPIIAHDIALAANVFHIDLAVLRAVMAVESRNSGYDSKRRPIILFEPHIFYRELVTPQRDAAVRAGLAYKTWGQRPYPTGSDAQYKRLAAAIRINPEAAYRSISMGLGQVLGQNYKAAGCKSAKEMFEQAKESEANQLRHMLNFIKTNNIIDELQRRNWYGFARVYNGPGQPAKYAAWLDREYRKWAKIVAKPREELTVQDLRDAGSKTIASADNAKTAIAVASVAGPTAGVALDAIQTGLEPVTRAVQTAQQAQSAWEWVSDNWQFLAVVALTIGFLAACWFAWRAMKMVEEERVMNARTGINARI